MKRIDKRPGVILHNILVARDMGGMVMMKESISPCRPDWGPTFLSTLPTENPFLTAEFMERYEKASRSPEQRRAMLEGSWDVFDEKPIVRESDLLKESRRRACDEAGIPFKEYYDTFLPPPSSELN